MKQLSTVLSNIKPGATVTEQPESSLPTLQLGSISDAGKMIIGQMIASKPREQAISTDRAKQAWQWLRLLRSHRKIKRKWQWKGDGAGMEPVDYAEYTLPADMTHKTVVAGLTELLRPCSPTVTAHFVRLHAFKPFFEADQERLEIVFEALYEDLKDQPEVAVVLALDDMRKTASRYFPSVYEIMQAVEDYRNLIYECLDFWNSNQ